MSNERKDHHFIKKPYYEGGIAAMKKFIKKNIKYPNDAKENNIEGAVLVKYEIDYSGNVVTAKVIKGLGYGCDEEAKRLVLLLKFEVPKNPRKLKVAFHKETKIIFKLPKKSPTKNILGAKKNENRMSISYTIKPKPKKASSNKKSYNYTI